MSKRDLLLMASIRAVIRGDMAVRGVAERFGVTEAQVARWRDIFEIAGMLALSHVLFGRSGGPLGQWGPRGTAHGSEPTTDCLHDPNTWGDRGDPTTSTLDPNNTSPFLKDTIPQKRMAKVPKRQSAGKAGSRSKVKKPNKRAKSKRKR